MKILIVEDELKTADYLHKGLTEQGCAVDLAHDGVDGQHLALTHDYDVIVLDVMLPKLDGFSVLRALRQVKQTPVIMLTARDRVEDRIKGLHDGADDYLIKPFSFLELLARLQALTRRGRTQEPMQLKIGNLQIDLISRKAYRGGDAHRPHGQGIRAARGAGAAPGRDPLEDRHRRAGVGHEFRQQHQHRRGRDQAPAR